MQDELERCNEVVSKGPNPFSDSVIGSDRIALLSEKEAFDLQTCSFGLSVKYSHTVGIERRSYDGEVRLINVL